MGERGWDALQLYSISRFIDVYASRAPESKLCNCGRSISAKAYGRALDLGTMVRRLESKASEWRSKVSETPRKTEF